MAYNFSTWLKPALEADPFVKDRLVLVNGWETRGRPESTGPHDPSGIVNHHTACMIRSGHDPASCMAVILGGNSVAPGPISQLLITWTPPGVRWNGNNADPRVVLLAAGRCNHAGAADDGYPWGAPDGNGSSIGKEMCGPGPWPDVVVELAERVDAGICRNRHWGSSQITTHNEYAESRKVDPSGSWAGQRGLALLTPWNPDVLRARVSARLTTASRPPVRRTLKVANRPKGEDVKVVQRRVKVTVDGDYGPVTGKAVQGFKGYMMKHPKPNTTWGSGCWRVHDWLLSLK